MRIKDFLEWFYQRMHNYNVFIPNENEYDDENDQPTNPATALRHQRYATRLYVSLLISK